MMTTHKFLGIVTRSSDKKGTISHRAICSCGHKTAALPTAALASEAFEVHAA